jgi:hypothetical protein
MVKVFFEGFGVGAMIVFAGIVVAEIKKHYAIGDALKDLFLSEEAKVKALKDKAIAFARKADAAALALVKRKR